jgi:hypothetical protein
MPSRTKSRSQPACIKRVARKVSKRKVSKIRKLVPCSRSQVRNPETNRCIKRVGKTSPSKVSKKKVSSKKTQVWKLLSFKDAPKLVGKKLYLLYEQHQDGKGEPAIIKGYCEPFGNCSVVSSKPKNSYDSLAIIDSHNKNTTADYSFDLDVAGKYYVSGSGSDWVKYKL